MDRIHGPTGAVLVGATFISLCLMTALAADYNPDASDAFEEIMAYHSHFVHHSPTSDLGKLRLPGTNLAFPWAKRLPQASMFGSSDLVLRSPPTKEEIILTGSHPSRRVEGLTATNSVKQRDISCSAMKNAKDDRYGLGVAPDVNVIGKGQAQKVCTHAINDNNLENIEGIIDAKQKSCLSGECRDSDDSRTSTPRQGNKMNIDVSGISVRAISTVPGGKAVATSNIVIKPVQIIVCPPEVEEKLK